MGAGKEKHYGDKIQSWMYPRYWADTKLFNVYSSTPEEVTEHDGFKFKWTGEQVVDTSRGTFYTRRYVIITAWVCFPGTSNWEINKYISSFRASENPSQAEKEINDAIIASREAFMKERQKKLAKKRKEKLLKEAEKNNISVEEMREINRRKREEKKKHNEMKKNVETTKQLLEVGPTLKELQDELSLLMDKINNTPEKVRPRNTYRTLRTIKKTVKYIRQWQNNK